MKKLPNVRESEIIRTIIINKCMGSIRKEKYRNSSVITFTSNIKYRKFSFQLLVLNS